MIIRQLQKSGASDQIYVIIPFHASNYFLRSFHLLVWAGFRRSQSKKVCNEKRKSRKLHSRAILKISFFLTPFFRQFWKVIDVLLLFPMFVMSFAGSSARKIKERSSGFFNTAFCRFKQKPSIYERTELQNLKDIHERLKTIFLAQKYNRAFTLGSFERFETDNACLFRVGNERGESSFLNVTRRPYAVKCSMSRGFVRPCVPQFDHPFGSWERGFYCFHIKIFALYIHLFTYCVLNDSGKTVHFVLRILLRNLTCASSVFLKSSYW